MIRITPIVKTGTKKVVHIQADDRDELIEVANVVGVGIRNPGTKQEHITVTPSESVDIASMFDYVQLERDIF